jgi:hypothetical protein
MCPMTTAHIKIKKHQPNQLALIHLWANGATSHMVCPASVSSGSDGEATSLYSYSTRIAMRTEVKGQAAFVVTSNSYSVTTSKHQGRIHRSIPLPLRLSDFNMPSVFDSVPVAEQFRMFEKRFAELLKDKQLSLVFTSECRFVGFDSTFYKGQIKDISEFVELLKNPRVKRFSSHSVWDCYSLYLKAEVFRRLFCKAEKKQSIKDIKKVFAAYLEKLKADSAKKAAERAEYYKKVKRLAVLYSEDLKQYWEQIVQTLVLEADCWRKFEKRSDEFFDARQLLIGTIKENICKVQKVEYSDLMSEWEDLQGINYQSEMRKRTGTLLRFNPDHGDIETNRGARLPETLCKALWKRYGGKVQDTEKGLPVEELPIALGHFNWTEAKDGNLTIGCHIIPASEVIALAMGRDW